MFLKVYAQGADPVEMRLFLHEGDRILSETWAYQYHPEAPGTLL